MCVYVKEGHVPESLDEEKTPSTFCPAEKRKRGMKKKKKKDPKPLKRQ
jgi:hypothetical protein